MIDVSKPTYDKPREWIKTSREHGIAWEDIMLARTTDDKALQSFLDMQMAMNFWPELSAEDWKVIVSQQKNAEENAKTIDLMKGTAIIIDPKAENATSIPTDQYSSWQLYRPASP